MKLTKDNAKVGMKLSHSNVRDCTAKITNIIPRVFLSEFTVEWEGPATAQSIGIVASLNRLAYSFDFSDDLSFWTILETEAHISLSIPQEKPCQVCSKRNDIGVRVCWHCGSVPH